MIDADVHHGALDMAGALMPYLSKSHQGQLEENGFVTGIGPFTDDGGVRGWRPDLLGEDVPAQLPAGGAVAWDPERAARQVFDERGVELAVLTGGPTYGASGIPDLDYASAICRAFNSWTFDTWLAADARYRFAMSVCSQDPEGAAAEIDRIGDSPGVCAVLLPTGSAKHLGQRAFEPIFKAAVAKGLPIALHAGAEGTGVFGQITAAGTPTYFAEAQMALPSFYQVHLSSFVFEGVFDRYPTLKVVLLGSGFAWLPSHLWRMDSDWKALRYHTPWVKRLPSEYVFEHVRFGTQPIETPLSGDELALTLKWIQAERTVLYASHHPRWDSEDPALVRELFPEGIARRIMAQNARDTLRL